MSQLLATLYPERYTPPGGTVAKSHKAIPQKDEPKVSMKVRDAEKARSEEAKRLIIESLQARGFTTAAFISADTGLAIPAVANQLKVLTRTKVAIRYESDKQPAIYSLA